MYIRFLSDYHFQVFVKILFYTCVFVVCVCVWEKERKRERERERVYISIMYTCKYTYNIHYLDGDTVPRIVGNDKAIVHEEKTIVSPIRSIGVIHQQLCRCVGIVRGNEVRDSDFACAVIWKTSKNVIFMYTSYTCTLVDFWMWQTSYSS